MAIVQNPVTGRSRKKFGTAVFTTQFDNNVMRTKPLQVNNPKTVGQLNQRFKFTTIVALLRPVLPIINSAYGKTLKKMSPFNKVVSINVKNAFFGTPPVLDPTKIVLCDIPGSTVNNVAMTGLANQVMSITWNANTNDALELASTITFIIFNSITNESVIFRNAAVRSAGSASVTVPVEWVGAKTTLHIMTTDFPHNNPENSFKVVKYKTGNDTESTVL